MSRSLNCSIHHTSQLIPSRRLQFRSTLPLGLYSFDSNRYRIRPFASQETKPSLKHKSNNNSKASPPLKTPPLPKPNAQITKPTPISTALPSVPPSTARTPDVAYRELEMPHLRLIFANILKHTRSGYVSTMLARVELFSSLVLNFWASSFPSGVLSS